MESGGLLKQGGNTSNEPGELRISSTHTLTHSRTGNSFQVDACAASLTEEPEEEDSGMDRECGVSCVDHQLWEAAQGYEDQMDVRATSVPPPGSVLSAETLPHKLDGRGRREKTAFFAEFKKTGLLLFAL